jgi:hypothetical protein
MPTTLVIRRATATDLPVIGVAAERGWVRLEAIVTRRRESHRRGFLLGRGFAQTDSVTYRWGILEGRHQTPPRLRPETRSPEPG